MNEHGSSMDDIERTLPVTRRTIDENASTDGLGIITLCRIP